MFILTGIEVLTFNQPRYQELIGSLWLKDDMIGLSKF